MVSSRRDMLCLLACLAVSQYLSARKASAEAVAAVRIRENITEFIKDTRKVEALRAGVRRMKERSRANRHDPLGWSYWAAIHWTSEAVPGELQGIYRQCDHSSPNYTALHFMSWHRAFLFFFETVLAGCRGGWTNRHVRAALLGLVQQSTNAGDFCARQCDNQPPLASSGTHRSYKLQT